MIQVKNFILLFCAISSYHHIILQHAYCSQSVTQESVVSKTSSFVTPTTSPTQNDECFDNSISNKCNHNAHETTTIPKYHPDTQSQLLNRLGRYDTLDDRTLNYDYHFSPSSGNETGTIRQIILIHRHGDRTPIQFSPQDPLKDEPFWAFHGYGQLTNRGKLRVFLLGKIMRIRYNNFMKNSVNKNQRISRSSGSLRCIESGQMFLASFLGLDNAGVVDSQELIWDKSNGNPLAHVWQPASIQSVPSHLDGMLAESATCNALTEEYNNIDESNDVKQIFEKYHHEKEVIKSVLGFDIDHFYKWFWGSSQIEVEREYFWSKMNPEILKIYDGMQEAGNLALKAFQSTPKSKRLRSGLLINDIIKNMEQYRDLHHKVAEDSGKLKKFVHYSAHDLTLVLLLGMFEQFEKFPYRPEYASNIVLELHHDTSANEWFIRIFYMPEVPSSFIELNLEPCEKGHPSKRCTLDRFSEMMKQYMIDSWQQWMKECRNDISTVNPYLPGS